MIGFEAGTDVYKMFIEELNSSGYSFSEISNGIYLHDDGKEVYLSELSFYVDGDEVKIVALINRKFRFVLAKIFKDEKGIEKIQFYFSEPVGKIKIDLKAVFDYVQNQFNYLVSEYKNAGLSGAKIDSVLHAHLSEKKFFWFGIEILYGDLNLRLIYDVNKSEELRSYNDITKYGREISS